MPTMKDVPGIFCPSCGGRLGVDFHDIVGHATHCREEQRKRLAKLIDAAAAAVKESCIECDHGGTDCGWTLCEKSPDGCCTMVLHNALDAFVNPLSDVAE
jgi:hypothetical protein